MQRTSRRAFVHTDLRHVGPQVVVRPDARQLDAAHQHPAMRRSGTRRLLYQAGGLSARPGHRWAPPLRLVRATVARSYDGQHRDNEAVMRHLDEHARDTDWVVHRAGIGGDGTSRGELRRSGRWISIGTCVDCTAYNLRTVFDDAAILTSDGSAYRRRR